VNERVVKSAEALSARTPNNSLREWALRWNRSTLRSRRGSDLDRSLSRAAWRRSHRIFDEQVDQIRRHAETMAHVVIAAFFESRSTTP